MEKEILRVAMASIEKAITTELIGYGKPLSKIVDSVIEENTPELRGIINQSIVDIIQHKNFKEALNQALKAKLAKTIVNKMGGELERRVNELKQDPTTRAKVTVALDGLMDEILSSKPKLI